MKTDLIDSRMRESKNIELNIERVCSHVELKSSIAKTLKLDESQVAVYADDDNVDNYDVVVVIVRYYESGFKTNIEIVNALHQQNPLAIQVALCSTLKSRILVEALDVVPVWIMCSTGGHLSYVRANEDDDDASLSLSVANPCRPFYKLNSSDFESQWKSIEVQSNHLIDTVSPYLLAEFPTIQAEYRVSEIDGYKGQLAQLFVWGINKDGKPVFLDIKDISVIACALEVICVFSGGDEDIAKNAKFKITTSSVELDQDSPGHAFKYSKEA